MRSDFEEKIFELIKNPGETPQNLDNIYKEIEKEFNYSKEETHRRLRELESQKKIRGIQIDGVGKVWIKT
jgi:DNA-binding Lrp family transcriptional regulator